VAFHRAGPTTENVGDLGLGTVLEVPEHDNGTLAHGQPHERPAQDQAVDRVPFLVRAVPPVGQLARVHLGRPPAAPPAHLYVVHHPARVRLRVAVDAEPAPRPVRTGERLLDQVLGEVAVARQEVRRPQQRGGLNMDEQVEVPGASHAWSIGGRLPGSSAVSVARTPTEAGRFTRRARRLTLRRTSTSTLTNA
jgi:hypothetical protein